MDCLGSINCGFLSTASTTVVFTEVGFEPTALLVFLVCVRVLKKNYPTLPLSYSGKWSEAESNYRRLPLQGSALPTGLSDHILPIIAGYDGFEPTTQ